MYILEGVFELIILVYFNAHLEYFFPILVCCLMKNQASLVSSSPAEIVWDARSCVGGVWVRVARFFLV
jgi:hypothetical protein